MTIWSNESGSYRVISRILVLLGHLVLLTIKVVENSLKTGLFRGLVINKRGHAKLTRAQTRFLRHTHNHGAREGPSAIANEARQLVCTIGRQIAILRQVLQILGGDTYSHYVRTIKVVIVAAREIVLSLLLQKLINFRGNDLAAEDKGHAVIKAALHGGVQLRQLF